MHEHHGGAAPNSGVALIPRRVHAFKYSFMKISKISGGVCAAEGFRAGAVHAGIKRVKSEKDDLAVVVSDVPCAAGGVFTKNLVKAAPVVFSMRALRMAKKSGFLGVVLNSGNANACTGAPGLAAAAKTALAAAMHFGGTKASFLVCSTGRIGVPMPMEKVEAGIAMLPPVVSRGGSTAAAVAIMTSDTFPKESAVRVAVGGQSFRIGGIAKGAGMINPDMATMLCTITTDLAAPASVLKKILTRVVERTFNRITVDGDMSTNDTVLVLANGASGAHIGGGGIEEAFEAGLQKVCDALARMIARDGEGTTKVIDLRVDGARSAADARKAADAVANSVLFKCALAGNDPNWGRILDALGYSGARFNPDRVSLFYGKHRLVHRGMPDSSVDIDGVKKLASLPEFSIRVDLGAGRAAHDVVMTDLTEEYVRLNLSE